MIRVIRMKKNAIKIIVITIIIILIGTSGSANISTDLKNNNKVKDIYAFMRNIDNKDNLENIEQSDLYFLDYPYYQYLSWTHIFI